MIIDITTNHLITFTFQFDPTITAKLRTIPGTNWYPDLRAWGAQWSPLCAWRCLKAFPERHAYTDTLWNTIQHNLFPPKTTDNNHPEFLYEFQRTGADFLRGVKNGILADCPGAGKTIQTIASSRTEETIAICCPVSMVYQWEKEIRRFDEDDISIIKTRKEQVHKSKWVIFPHSLLVPLHKNLIAKKFPCLIIDEAHMFRNHESKRAKALMAIASRCPRVIPVTGTPIYNEVDDLFPLLVATKQVTANDHGFFLDRYCGKNVLGGRANRSYGLTNKDELKEFMERITIKRSRSEIGRQLPPITRTVQTVDISNLGDYMNQFIETRQHIGSGSATRTTEMIKINHLRRLSAIGKVEAAREVVENLIYSDEKVVIISSFLEPIRKLEDHFPHNSISVDGSLSPRARSKRIDMFQTSSRYKIALCSMETGGVGVTLTAARYLIALDIPWTAAQIQQFEARIYRESQTLPTFVIYLIGNNTIDKKMLSITKKKGEWAESVFATEENESYVEIIEELKQYISKPND